MADGYQLDYKKVHNTLGEPNKNKYGEEIGQYITNLWEKEYTKFTQSEYWVSGTWGFEGILTKNESTAFPSYTSTSYFNERFVGSQTFFSAKIWLIDYNKVYNGILAYNSRTETWETTLSFFGNPNDPIAQNTTLHFKIIQLEDSSHNIFNYNPLYFLYWNIINLRNTTIWSSNPYYFSNLIPLEVSELYSIQNLCTRKPYYAIIGYDQQRDEYVVVTNDTLYTNFDQLSNFYFITPKTGSVIDNGSHIHISANFDIDIDQWYLIFFDTYPIEYEEPRFCYNSSVPLTISQEGVVLNNITDITINNLTVYTAEKYDDEVAWNILRTIPPVLNYHDDHAPTRVSLPDEIKDSRFQNWLKFKKYNIALVIVRDHLSTEEVHTYNHNGVKFTVTNKRYFILKYLKESRLKLPTYEWLNTSLNTIYAFNYLDNSKETILSRRIAHESGRTYGCSKAQIVNQCQLCGPDTPGETPAKTHICFALWVVPQHGTYYNSDHINNGSFIHEIPQDPNYYESTTVVLNSLLW